MPELRQGEQVTGHFRLIGMQGEDMMQFLHVDQEAHYSVDTTVADEETYLVAKDLHTGVLVDATLEIQQQHEPARLVDCEIIERKYMIYLSVDELHEDTLDVAWENRDQDTDRIAIPRRNQANDEVTGELKMFYNRFQQEDGTVDTIYNKILDGTIILEPLLTGEKNDFLETPPNGVIVLEHTNRDYIAFYLTKEMDQIGDIINEIDPSLTELLPEFAK